MISKKLLIKLLKTKFHAAIIISAAYFGAENHQWWDRAKIRLFHHNQTTPESYYKGELEYKKHEDVYGSLIPKISNPITGDVLYSVDKYGLPYEDSFLWPSLTKRILDLQDQDKLTSAQGEIRALDSVITEQLEKESEILTFDTETGMESTHYVADTIHTMTTTEPIDLFSPTETIGDIYSPSFADSTGTRPPDPSPKNRRPYWGVGLVVLTGLLGLGYYKARKESQL